MDFRIEKDTMGEIKVPKDKYWGAQTQRSLENFKIGTEKMPKEIIDAFAILKKSAAISNFRLKKMDEKISNTISKVCDEIIEGKLDGNFPLVIWQTGSGTQSNMNFNEVIARRGNEILNENLIHPNDHVNMSQSSNDTFPTAMHISAYFAVEKKLLPAIKKLYGTFNKHVDEYKDVVKNGRTHLQDATPLSLGQEISGWEYMLLNNEKMIKAALEYVKNSLALGGTAVGTGLNAPENFDVFSAQEISSATETKFKTSENKFHSLTSKDELAFLHGALNSLAANLLKIANDVRWLASGPRSGIGEIIIPENEPGSSIMPGKVNPTQCEALTMVCAQVMGNDVTVNFCASQGNLELNVFMPVLIYNFLQSANLLADSIVSFNDNCAVGIKPNYDRIEENLNKSLMLVTALNPYIGYEKSAKVANTAYLDNSTLKEAALKLGYLTEEEFDKYLVPKNMI